MQRKETVRKEDVVQAVIIADTYHNTFRPVTDFPTLMPLVNKPLLEYTLRCLSSAKVDEAIVFCTSDTEEVKSFISNQEWGRMSVSVVTSDRCGSLGDAMRDLDAKALIRGDFILLSGNLVGNLELLPALERHKKIQKSDKGAAMTLIYKKCGKKTRSSEDELFLGIDNKTDRVIAFQRRLNGGMMEVNMEAILGHGQVDIRNDLLDCKICVCSVTVPPLFSDNFDFQTLDDFVHGLIINEDILASTVYSYILPNNQYAAGVTSWQNYHYISMDIIHRWTYPFVPDRWEDEVYTINRNSVYLQNDVALAKDCRLRSDVVVGSKSSIQEMTSVASSVIGKNCHIGPNCVITNSHIFDNVNIASGSSLDFCVIGNGSNIGDGVSLKNCIVGQGVTLEKGSPIEQQRIQRSKTSEFNEAVGVKAFTYKSDSEDDSSDEDSEDEGYVAPTWRGLVLEPSPAIVVADDSDSDSGDSMRPESPIQDDANLFYSEVVDSMLRGYEDKLPCTNLILEINSSRYAYNVPLNEVNYNVVRAILTLQHDFSWDSLTNRLKYFMPLFVNYVRNGSAMIDCLNAIEDVAEINPPLKSVTMKLIHLLYDKDVLEEDAIMKWFSHPRNPSDGQSLRKIVKPFIDWLENAESSEED
uniref:Translation initiation factor eIF2B subunit epsilon n=1 Tax=Lygus hesperus TaxID=30085 RepID=A0A0A9XB24_LYGHE